MKRILVLLVVAFCFFSFISKASAEDKIICFEIGEVKLVPKVGIVFRAKNTEGKWFKKVCTRPEIEEFKWYFNVEDAGELFGRKIYGSSFEAAFQNIIHYRDNMTLLDKKANLLAYRSHSKTICCLPSGYEFKKEDVDGELLAKSNARLNTISNGAAEFLPIDPQEISNLPADFLVAYRYKKGSESFVVILTTSKETPILYR